MVDYLVVIGHHGEVVRTKITIQAGTSHETYVYLCRECAQRFTHWHVDSLDRYTLDALLGQHVGKERHSHVVGYHLYASDLGQLAVSTQRVAEVGVVELLGIQHVDAVEFFARGIDSYAVGLIGYTRDEEHLLGYHSAAPAHWNHLFCTVVIIELQLFGFYAGYARSACQLLINHLLQFGCRYHTGAVALGIGLKVYVYLLQYVAIHIC